MIDAIRETFFGECVEQLDALEQGLLRLETGAGDADTIAAVFRAVHSIKGGAGAFGLDALVRFAHRFETCLDALRAGRLAPEPPVIGSLLRAADLLADLVAASRAGDAVDPARCSDLEAMLAALTPEPESDGFDELAFTPVAVAFDTLTRETPTLEAPMLEAPTLDTGSRRWIVRFRPTRELYASANEAGLLLRDLCALGTAEVVLDTADLPALDTLDPDDAHLAWTVSLATDAAEADIRAVFEFVEGLCELSIAPEQPATPDSETLVPAAPPPASAPITAVPSASAPAPSAPALSAAALSAPALSALAPPARPTIRVDLERVDRLIDLVGELVITQSMLAQRVAVSGTHGTGTAVVLDGLEQLTREIQDSVMAIRAQPVRAVFQRMQRVTREAAASTGKPVRLVSEGDATELDQTVLEHLVDPLTHMVRNAIDHGIEDADGRTADGKPAEGTVRLSAAHRSGRIVIEVADDGRGLDRARVRAKAVERGLIAADASLGDDEIDHLIFLPGFSTVDTVSDLSGRGVGMDVVRSAIQALGGRIAIASRPGRGSTFTLSLPLTLAVLDGMVVTVSGQTLIVPVTAIIETLQPRPVDMHVLGEGTRVIAIRGGYVPLIEVGHALGFAECAAGRVALLVEAEGGRRATLLVDAIKGQRQVVIKSLEKNYRQVPGIAAATILGNGRVALILDIDHIVGAAPVASARAERLPCST